MNLIHIAGHLGADPESRFTPGGQKVVTLRVAAKVRRGSKDETIWWRVTLWGDQFDKMLPYLKKGTGLMVIGEMSKPEIYTDREGKPQISMNMTAFNVMFSPFGRTDRSNENQETVGSTASTENFYQPVGATTAQPEQTNTQMSGGLSSGSAPATGGYQMPSDDEIPF